jgi:hypothetical protein
MAYKPKVLEVAAGGTGDATLTNHGVLIGAGTNPVNATSAGLANQVLQSGGASADPVYSTATYPSTATGTGKLLRADGTNWVESTLTIPDTIVANSFFYASSANVLAPITPAANSVLVTNGSNVPSLSTTLPSAVQGNITTVGTITSGVWNGSTIDVAHGGTGRTTLSDHGLLVGAGTTAITQLPTGSANQILQSGGASADPFYSTATYPSTTTINQILFSSGNNAVSQITAGIDGVLVSSHTGVPSWLANGTSGYVLTANTNAPPSWQLNATTDYHVARFIVSAGGSADGANYSTIASAITAAVAATGVQTIFIQPGTYTENLTLAANVNLVAFVGDNDTPTVTIVGKATATFAGSCTISGIRLTTNSDNFLAVTGSNATIVTLDNCYLNCSNATGITFSVSNTASRIYLRNCGGDLGTTGIGLITSTSTGQFKAYHTIFTNSGSSLTASTTSTSLIVLRFCEMQIAFSATSTGSIDAKYCNLDTSGFNLLSLAVTGTGISTYENCAFGGGTAAACTVGSGATVRFWNCSINSSNAAVVSGAGTFAYANLIYLGTSSTITATTQTILLTGPSATFGSSNNGGTNSVIVSNTSNTASSRANITASVGGTSSEDASFSSVITGGQTWSWGGDNSDSDAFVISANASLGTTNIMRSASTGEINYPLQSCFLAYLASADNNRTGAGTAYTLGTNTALTEVYDQNSDFNTNGTFTAPVTGRYHMDGCGYMTGCTVAAQFAGSFNSSNRLYSRLWTRAASNFNGCCSHNSYVDMDAGDTCTFQVTVTGEAGDTVDFLTDATAAYTTFSGKLCA